MSFMFLSYSWWRTGFSLLLRLSYVMHANSQFRRCIEHWTAGAGHLDRIPLQMQMHGGHMRRAGAQCAASHSPGRLLPLFSLLDCMESGNWLAGFARELCQRQFLGELDSWRDLQLSAMAEKSVPRREDQEEFKMEGRLEGQDFFLCVVSMFAVWLCGFLLAHTHHKATWALGLLLLSVPIPEALAYSWRWSTGNQQRTPTAPQRWLKCRVHISLHCTEYEWMLQIDYSSLSLLQRHLLYSLLLIFFLFSIPLYFCNRNKSIIYKIYSVGIRQTKGCVCRFIPIPVCPLTGRWITPFQRRRSSVLFAAVVAWADFSDDFKAGHIIVGASHKHAVRSRFGLCWFRRLHDWNVRGIWQLSLSGRMGGMKTKASCKMQLL